jgi:hypothetical protein
MILRNPRLALAIFLMPSREGKGNKLRVTNKSCNSSTIPTPMLTETQIAAPNLLDPFGILRGSRAPGAPTGKEQGPEAKNERPDPFEGKEPKDIMRELKEAAKWNVSEEDVVAALEAHTDNSRLRDAYLAYFQQAKAGAFDAPAWYSRSILFSGETWKKGVILKAVSNIWTIAEDLAIAIGDVLGYTPYAPVGWLVQFGGAVSSVIHDVVDYKLGLKTYEESRKSLISTSLGMIPYFGDPIDVQNIILDMKDLGKVPQ